MCKDGQGVQGSRHHKENTRCFDVLSWFLQMLTDTGRGLPDQDKASWTRRPQHREVRGPPGSPQVTLLTGIEAGLTCTRVRMTSMGLVRMEAVAAARGPETA